MKYPQGHHPNQTNVRKIQESHKSFMIRMLAMAKYPVGEIHKMLSSPEAAAEHGYEVTDVSYVQCSKVLKELRETRQDEIIKYQGKYMADFSTIPLAHKKNRIEQLAGLYVKVDKMMSNAFDPEGKQLPISELRKVDLKRKLLKDIKDEIGEDIEKLADALRASGNTFVDVTLTPAQRAELAFVLTSETIVLPNLDPTKEISPTNGGGNGSALPGN